MTDPQQRQYVTGAGFAWRVVVAQQLRKFLVSPLIALGLVAALFGYLSLWGSLGANWPLWWLFIALALFYGFLLGVTLLVSWAVLRRHLPVGSRFTATLRASTLAFSGPLGEADVDYATYRKVTTRGGLVFLRMRSSVAETVLPVELFPGDEYDRLVASVAAAPAGPVSRELDGTLAHEYVTDEGYVGRLSRATTAYALTRPGLLVMLILIAVPGAIGLLLIALSLVLRRDPTAGFGALAVSVVILGLIIGLSSLTIWRTLRRQSPVGSRYGLGFTDSGLTLRTPQFSTEIPFDRIRGVKRRGEFTLITLNPGRAMIPSALLPLEAEAHLLSRVQR